MADSDIKPQEEACDGNCPIYECDCSHHDAMQYNAIIEDNLKEYLHPKIDPETGKEIYIDDLPF